MEYEYKCEVLERMSNPELDEVTRRELIDIFLDDGAHFVMADSEDRTNEADAYWCNDLFSCKIACPSDDGKTLDLPYGFWGYGISSHRSLYIRGVYRDHWEIIKQNVTLGKRNAIYLINGTCGARKIVEAFYFINQILNSSGPDAPPVIYSTHSTHYCIHFRGLYFHGTDHHKFTESISYRMMLCTTDQIWHISDTESDPLSLSRGNYGPEIVITSPAREKKGQKEVQKT
jgi:hypothetical protein